MRLTAMGSSSLQPHYGFFQTTTSPETRRFIRQLLPDLDPGIRKAVRVLLENQIETFESCEGGAWTFVPRAHSQVLRHAGGRLASRGGLSRAWAPSLKPATGMVHP